MSIQEKIQRALEIARKWEDQNIGATTDELRELRSLSEDIVDAAIRTIRDREVEA